MIVFLRDASKEKIGSSSGYIVKNVGFTIYRNLLFLFFLPTRKQFGSDVRTPFAGK